MNLTSNPHALQSMITESVDRFLNEYRKGRTDFSNFTSIFSRFLQKLPDPPLEIVWFYSALTFHSTKFSDQNSSSSALMTKNLFQLLVSCSSSCNALKKIAVLAPVIYELNNLVSEGEKWRKEAEILLEVIYSYLSIFCGSNFEQGDEFGGFSYCFMDLVGVWTVDRIRETCKLGEELSLSMFFPFVSDGILNGITSEGIEVSYLAGIVMAQVFLLRLCFKFGSGVSRIEMVKELRDCAVQMMTAFQSFHFVDILLKILIEPEPLLSITSQSLLNSEDEVFLREVLYDVAIMEHSFLGSQKGIHHLPKESLKNLAIRWESGKKSKGVYYVKAFSECFLLSQLFKWVMNESKTSKPEVSSSPLSLIEWLLTLEDEGLRVFDNEISKNHAKAIVSKSRKGYFVAESDWKSSVCYGDYYEGKGEEKVDSDLEMVDSKETKKRKEGMKDEMNRQVKCKIDENFATENGSLLNEEEALSSGSEVDNPSSDENFEPMEQ